jgi:hypothetical protein
LWTSFDGSDPSGARSFDRREYAGKAGITVPLTGEGFLPNLGTSELALDIGRVDLGRSGTIKRYSAGLNWNPVSWLRLTAGEAKDGTAILPELLSSPLFISENVPFFDPLRNETADVRLISGGAANVRNQTQRTRTLSLTATPPSEYNLQLNADVQELKIGNPLGALPPPSSAVVLAFPERFQRDAAGRLVVVDTTSVNFDRQTTRQLRLGLNFVVPIASARSVPEAGKPRGRRIPATTLQVNAAHTYLIDSTTVIRPGLAAVNLLDGGAIGIGGGQQRNFTTGSVALTRGATGARLNLTRRGRSFLQTGTAAMPDRLTFQPLFKADLRLFAEIGQLLPNVAHTEGTRLTLAIENLSNDRERITNLAGVVPQAYQGAFRDPVGRTI